MTINGNSDGKLTTMITAAPALICLRVIERQSHKLIISYYHIFYNSAFTMTHLFVLSEVISSEELWQLWQSWLLPTFASASSKDRNLNCCIWLDRSYCTLATTIVVFLSLMISDNHDGSCLDVPQAHPKALCGKLGTSYYQCSCASDDGGEDENGYF